MRLLDRYLLRELLAPLGFCLCGFLIFWVASDLFTGLEDLLEKHKLHGLDIVEYYIVRSPEFLAVVLPIALLLAMLYTLTNHSRHHEITAIRAAGVSLWRLCAPYFAVGFALSLVLLGLNESLIPNSADRVDRILNRRLPQDATLKKNQVRNFGFINSRDNRRWLIGIYDWKTGEMIRPIVDCQLADGSWRKLFADYAIWTNRALTFFNAKEYKELAETNSDLVPILQTNRLVPDFSETPREVRSELKMSERLSLRNSKKADIPIIEILSYLHLHPGLRRPDHLTSAQRSDRYWLYTKLQGRLAAPWTCLVVVLIAIPFGAASGRRNVFVGVAGSIFICFAYFILQTVGLAAGIGGYVAPWLAAWMPNLAFGIAGLWMTAKVR
jgi:lipopolysaccharide export system permease protein